MNEYDQLIQESHKHTGLVNKVTKNDFSMIQVIGTGSYGKVILVRKKFNMSNFDEDGVPTDEKVKNKVFAMKVIKKSHVR